jgi:hypothetical protein
VKAHNWAVYFVATTLNAAKPNALYSEKLGMQQKTTDNLACVYGGAQQATG